MNSILDAVLAAQERNKREDRLREMRQQEMAPVLPTGSRPILPAVNDMGFGGDGPPDQDNVRDTRSISEQYQDMVEANRYTGIGSLMPGGMATKLINDYRIAEMEEQYPSLRPQDPYSEYARNRFSTVGQVMLGRGHPTQEGKTFTTVYDRLIGREPTWLESLARVNQRVDNGGGGSRNFNITGSDSGNEGDIGGYGASSLSYDSFDDTQVA